MHLILETRRRHSIVRPPWDTVRSIRDQAIDALVAELRDGRSPTRRALGVDWPGDPRPCLADLVDTGIVDVPTGLARCPTVRVDVHGLALDAWIAHHPEARVLAWLHRNVARHGWIDGGDRVAFADQIEDAIDAGLIAPDASPTDIPARGWADIADWARVGRDVVVTSFHVGGPDRYLAIDAGLWSPNPVGPDDDPWGGEDDPWDNLKRRYRWDLCLEALHRLPSRRWNPTDQTPYSPCPLTRLDQALHQAERTLAVGADHD